MTDQDSDNNSLPIANIGRIMKQTLPLGAKVSKEAKEMMQECALEFVSFVTGEASARCLKENRRTVNGDDICWALGSLGLDNYAEAMLRYLSKFRVSEKQRCRNNKKASGIQEEPNAPIRSFDFLILEKEGESAGKPF